jgi:hypothetical protein
VSFSALAVELGGEVVRPGLDRLRSAVAAIGAAFTAAARLPGWAVLGRWRFACAVTGGSHALDAEPYSAHVRGEHYSAWRPRRPALQLAAAAP